MSPHPTPGQSPADAFHTALTVMERRREKQRLTTGSRSLDELLGGLEPGGFYLFYGPGEEELDALLHRLVFEAIRSSPDLGEAVYVLCGNYRRSRTMMDLDYLLSLFAEAGLDVDYALSRIHMVYAFSERQLIQVPRLVERIMGDAEPALVAVQQLTKLFYGPDAVRFEDPAEFTGVVSGLRQLCYERDTVLAATCRPAGRSLTPLPEGGAYLKHAATAMVYLRRMRGDEMSAHLVKHPESARIGRRISLDGRETPWGG
ncbi:MAG: hypothetical protein ABIJ47_15245 [Candidatus Bathyarchaeota archaeon]